MHPIFEKPKERAKPAPINMTKIREKTANELKLAPLVVKAREIYPDWDIFNEMSKRMRLIYMNEQAIDTTSIV